MLFKTNSLIGFTCSCLFGSHGDSSQGMLGKSKVLERLLLGLLLLLEPKDDPTKLLIN